MEYYNKRRLITGISLFLLLGFYLFRNLSESVRVFGFIFGIFLFYAVDHMFKINFEFRHYLIAIIVLVGGILLSPLYFLNENYDKVLHFIFPILGSFVMFYIIDKQKISIQWKLLVTFMFIVSFIAIHEMGEYLIDKLFDFKLQGVYLRDVSGIEKLNLVLSQHEDTMIDMIFGFFGALTFSLGKTISYFIKKFKKKK